LRVDDQLDDGEERRRTKVIPHAFGEKAVIKLMNAVLMRARLGRELAACRLAIR
jgi:hypothetical protein